MSEQTPLIELAVMVRDLSEYHLKLRNALRPLTTAERSGKSHPGPRLPVRVDALDALVTLERSAVAWFLELRDETDGYGPSTTRELLEWLDRRLTHWPTSKRPDWFEAIMHQIEVSHAHAQTVLDIVPKPLSTRLACPHCGKGITIWPGQGVISCRNRHCRCASEDCGCQRGHGHRWPEREWRMLGLLMEQPKENKQ